MYINIILFIEIKYARHKRKTQWELERIKHILVRSAKRKKR